LTYRTVNPQSCILYIYSTNIGTEYFKHGIYSPFFPLRNAVCFIILTYLVRVLFTFYIQCVLKFKKNNSGAKKLKTESCVLLNVNKQVRNTLKGKTIKKTRFMFNLLKSNRFCTYVCLTLNNYKWCSLCVECFVRISEQIATFALQNIIRLVLYNRGGECLQRGTR